MKNLFFLILLTPILIHAQPIVTSSVYPTDGLQLDIIGHCSSSNDPYEEVIGANVTWDYSELIGCDQEWLVTFGDAAEGQNTAQFPLANKYYDFNGFFEFYNIVSDTSWTLNGLGFESPNIFSYGTEVFLLKFPAKLGDSWTNEYTITNNEGTHNIISTFTIDGSGTLILPNATYENVIRVHGFEHNEDDNPYNPIFTEHVYYYYSPDYQYHLFHMLVFDECQYQPNPISVSTSTFDQSASLKPTISPNPATNPLELTVTLDIQNDVDLHLYNSMGQLVLSKTDLQIHGGKYHLSSDRDFENGLYLLHISSGANQYNTKLVINN